MASAEAAASTAPPSAKSAKSKGLMVMIVAAVALSIAASGGVSFYISHKATGSSAEESGSDHATEAEGKEGEHDGVPAAATYLALDPAFVVNLEDPDAPRFLQAEIQVMSRDAVALETVKAQLPRIRNSILMLLGQQKPADLGTRTGKEKLQAEVLAEVQKVMQAETGKPVVEAVYFTSFVMQ